MARQPKQVKRCPVCEGPLKRTIGAKTRRKYWECVNGGVHCFRIPIPKREAS